MNRPRRKALQEAHLQFVRESELLDKIKKRRRRGLYRRLVAYGILATVVTCAFISIFLSQHQLLQAKQQERESLEAELQVANQAEIELKEEIERLNDYEYVGEIARRDFFFSKKGETIFKLPTDTSTN